MDAPPNPCSCGSENFERVTVLRPNGTPYATDFVACAECRVMYFGPADRKLWRIENSGAGIGGPS